MKSDFIRAINQVCAERGLSEEVVLEAVEQALVSAYKRDFGGLANVTAKIAPDSGQVRIFTEKEVVEEVEDDRSQISLGEARELVEEVALGETVLVETTPSNFGRIAAQTAKQVILQRIREAERDALYEAFADKEGEILNGMVQSINSQAVILSLGKAEAILPRSEQVPNERYRPRQRLRVYVLSVTKTSRGPQIIVSRTHWAMLRRLLELEVPEIYNGTVEIKAIAREPGSRSKVAVAALQPGVDPVGACVGMRGVRIQSIVNELGGEKIDIVEWSPDPKEFIAKALSPARPVSVELVEDKEMGKTAIVVVPEKQLSLAIGREGQNARLAAKLTGWRIDIMSPAEAAERVARLAAKETARLAEALAKGELEPGEITEETPIQVLGLSTRLQNILEQTGVTQVGGLLERLEKGEEELLAIPGLGPKSLEEIEERLKMANLYSVVVEEAVPAPALEEAVLEVVEVVPEEVAPVEAGAEEAKEAEVALEEVKPAEIEIVPEEIPLGEEEEEWEGEEEEEEEWEEEKLIFAGRKKKRKRDLVYDERLGEVVARKLRRPSRRRDDWQREIELWEQGEYDYDLDLEEEESE
ncbi:MAG: transcription termination factor NusA [Anaerolineae bacterium]